MVTPLLSPSVVKPNPTRNTARLVGCVRRVLLCSLLSLPAVVPADTLDGRSAEPMAQRVQQQIERWLHQAEQGDATALFNLGQFYRKGVGMPPDRVQAARFYRRAAELGHRAAQFNLGTLYYFDPSGQPDYDQARHWWRQAAEQGDAGAAYQLALLYLNGGDQPADTEQALFWMRKAQAVGHPDATAALGQMQALQSDELIYYTVQLGSFSELGAAQVAGKRFQSRSADVLGGLSIHITSARMKDGKAIYRVHTGQFNDRADADQVCEQLKAHSLKCFVARQ
ncbi:SPOR domain-containing protein [Marinobacterium sp. MBR-109]|uniref:SPOR domain-containing protein n=1 Tax=Marinobacterium sp. MBR-109 TaxID=3156462 RepID=UPI003395A0FF